MYVRCFAWCLQKTWDSQLLYYSIFAIASWKWQTDQPALCSCHWRSTMPLSTLPFPAKASAHLWQTSVFFSKLLRSIPEQHRHPARTFVKSELRASAFGVRASAAFWTFAFQGPETYEMPMDLYGPLKLDLKTCSQDELKLKVAWKNI